MVQAMFYEKSILSNGITVLSETMPGVRSVTLGIWFKVGSRDEFSSEAGMSHFMEHMLFKGTPARSASDISEAFDSMGAEINAFTSKEHTCFYARFVDEYLEPSLEILADMLLNPRFSPDDVASERQVVIEEIARAEDSPDDYVYELLGDEMFPTCTIGRPIVGTRQSVGGFTHDDLVAYHDKHYHAANCTVAASGSVDHAKLVQLVEAYFSPMRVGERNVRAYEPESPRGRLNVAEKDTEQANIVFGTHGIPLGDDDRFASSLMETALGGGMSSRLFQEVREKRGLVYSIYAGSASYQGVGLFSVYAGTRLENLPEVVRLVLAEIERMRDGGIGSDELERVRAYAVGQTILSMESTRARMARLGRASVGEIPLMSMEETIEAYRIVTVDDVARVASRVLVEEPVLAIVSSAGEDGVRDLLKDVIRL